MVRGARETLFFQVFVRPSICPSRYFPVNNWAKFNQTCYMNPSHGKGVQEEVSHAIGNISNERGDLWRRVIDCTF